LPLLRWDVDAPTNPPRITWLRVASTNQVTHDAASPTKSIYATRQFGEIGISLWNTSTGEGLGHLHGRRELDLSFPARFSPDGRKLVCVLYPDEIVLVDVTSPRDVFRKKLSVPHLFDVAFSPDGRLLAVAGGDHMVRLCDVGSLRELATLKGHQQGVSGVAFSHDGRSLASCSYGGVVKLWCLPARREVATLVQGVQDLTFVAFAPDDSAVITGGWADPVRIVRAPSLAETTASR
jgi:hypothetical protein